ncbi:MAG: nucleotide exchange factor GrpE [Pseudomonadota bacterium]
MASDKPNPNEEPTAEQPTQEEPTAEDLNEIEAEANEAAVEDPDVAQAPVTEESDEVGAVSELKDQLLRQMAEVENIKRRAARDVENAHKFATEKLLNELFPVLDSLEKAVETATATEGAQAIAEGVSLSLKLFVDTLSKNGVEQIDPLGQPFDPQLHEAMTMVPNPDAEPNSVMDVMAKGYVLNGRLVRAAKVIVVKGD